MPHVILLILSLCLAAFNWHLHSAKNTKIAALEKSLADLEFNSEWERERSTDLVRQWDRLKSHSSNQFRSMQYIFWQHHVSWKTAGKDGWIEEWQPPFNEYRAWEEFCFMLARWREQIDVGWNLGYSPLLLNHRLIDD